VAIGDLLDRMRYDGCGGLAGEAEGVSPRVRRIVLITNPMLEAAPYRRR
jgi:hypothetical protein